MQSMEDHREWKNTVIGYPVNKVQESLPTPTTEVPTAFAVDDDSPSCCSKELQQLKNEVCAVPAFVTLMPFFGILYIILSNYMFLPPQFTIYQLMFSPFNVSSSSNLTAQWVVSFSVINPNFNSERKIYCENFTTSVFYKNEKISTVPVDPFFTSRNHMLFDLVNTNVSTAYITGSAADAIVADSAGGAVNFTVIMNSTARINSTSDREELREITVWCEDIKVVYSSNVMNNAGTMLGEPKHCTARFVS